MFKNRAKKILWLLYSCVYTVRDTGLHWNVYECMLHWTKWTTMTLHCKSTFKSFCWNTIVKNVWTYKRCLLAPWWLVKTCRCVVFLKAIFDLELMVRWDYYHKKRNQVNLKVATNRAQTSSITFLSVCVMKLLIPLFFFFICEQRYSNTNVFDNHETSCNIN